MPKKEFSGVTETPGLGASKEQLSMLYTRYKFAAGYCDGKAVLEVACGSGQGLGYLEKVSSRVVGGDIDDKNLRIARNLYRQRKRIGIQKFDAQALPFRESSFDVIIIYEALYYLRDPEGFFEECRRVLGKKGVVLICTVNKEWPDFNPSPFSTRYFSGGQLSSLLQEKGFKTRVYAGFPVAGNSIRSILTSFIKRAAVFFHLIPKTMKGKQLLKRIFFGKLLVLPGEVSEGMAGYYEPVPLNPSEKTARFKVLYVVGQCS